jgi:hypothetical protein
VDNAATLGVSSNTGVINANVVNARLLQESAVLQSGSVVNVDNTISASTTLNSGSSACRARPAGSAHGARPAPRC